jgi:hypothetical protein
MGIVALDDATIVKKQYDLPIVEQGQRMPSQLQKQILLDSPTLSAPRAAPSDRHSPLKVELPFPAIVRGVDAADHAFEERIALDNLSANSLSLTLRRRIEAGAKLFLVVRLSIEPADLVPAPRVAIYGTVERATPQSGGSYTLAVIFSHYRFLYLSGE